MNRRAFMFGSAAAAALATGSPLLAFQRNPVRRSDAEWRRLLSPAAYQVLRRGATERPYSSALNREGRRGTFQCAGCRASLFRSQTKFDSGTGWPSFHAPISGAVGTRQEADGRTEVHCRRCEGHLGHVFDDGPRPTGLRYCINGVALHFQPGG